MVGLPPAEEVFETLMSNLKNLTPIHFNSKISIYLDDETLKNTIDIFTNQLAAVKNNIQKNQLNQALEEYKKLIRFKGVENEEVKKQFEALSREFTSYIKN